MRVAVGRYNIRGLEKEIQAVVECSPIAAVKRRCKGVGMVVFGDAADNLFEQSLGSYVFFFGKL